MDKESTREDRAAASEFGRRGILLSGFVLSGHAEAQVRRWVEGEITFEQLRADAIARYAVVRP